jgi:nitrite reductase/ring-hydroxylating ferredoxin subunit
MTPAVDSIRLGDYSLVGKDTPLAIEKGLAEATWYASPISREQMRELLVRRDWPAVRDTVLWFALIIGSGWASAKLWQTGSWWAAAPFLIYGVLYASTSDSRWHESGHGTAFKTDWLSDGSLHATDGLCTHGHTHLADSLVKGRLIECPKHNGRFDITDGSPQREPVCVALETYRVQEHDGKVLIRLSS